MEFRRAVHEDDPARPVSEYGVSHLAGTQLVSLASAVGDVDRAVALIREAQLLTGVAGFHGEVREAAAAPARSATVDGMLADVSRAADALKSMPTHEPTDSVLGVRAGMDER